MAGPTQAPTELLDRYYPRVLGLAYQALGDAALAAQAAETIFDRIIYEGASGHIGIWRAAVSVLRTYLARGFAVEPLASDAAGWQGMLLDGLAEIEPEARILLILRYHEGLDYDQLAEVLEMKVEQVRLEVVGTRIQLMDVLGLRDALR